jgi:hypothetical protein
MSIADSVDTQIGVALSDARFPAQKWHFISHSMVRNTKAAKPQFCQNTS